MSSQVPDPARSTELSESGLRIPSDLLGGIIMVAFGAFFLVNSGEDMRD